jgi:hypothetical protein
LIDAHGPLTVEPSRSPVPVPLDFGASASEPNAAFANSLVTSGSEL